MKNTFLSKLTLSVLTVGMMAGLTACNQPKPVNNPGEKTATTASTPASTASTNANAHADHIKTMASATATTQSAHMDAYIGMMGKMHEDMSAGVQAKNADVAFAKGMIPHHQGAIEMAKIELQYGKDSEMKALAQKIIDAQDPEIKLMQDWLANNETKAETAKNLDEIAKAYQDANMKNHDAMMQGVMDNDPDIAFAKGMIPHHQGAIDMANVEEKFGKNTQMLTLAKQIKQAQTPEIKQMQDWLAKKGVK